MTPSDVPPLRLLLLWGRGNTESAEHISATVIHGRTVEDLVLIHSEQNISALWERPGGQALSHEAVDERLMNWCQYKY